MGAPTRSPSCTATFSSAAWRCSRITRPLYSLPRSAISSAMLRMASSGDSVRLSATKLPEPAVRTSQPSATSSRSALLTVIRLTVNCSHRAASVGIRSPA